MAISKEPTSLQVMIDPTKRESFEYLNYSGSMITNYARCTREIKSRIAMARAAFNRKKTFHQYSGLKFKEETSEMLHLDHSIVWC